MNDTNNNDDALRQFVAKRLSSGDTYHGDAM